MSTPDDELQKIFRQNRKELLDKKETPHFPPLDTQKNIVPTPSGWVEVDIKHPIKTFSNYKPGKNFRDFLIEINEKKVISSQRDRSLEKKVWQQKIQPINDRCFNGEFHYDPCPGVAELTDESIVLVHNKIFQMFNKLIDFPSQLTQMAPPIDQDRQAKELVLAFDDIVLKKLRAGLGNPNKNELFFDFLQDVCDCNLLPAFLTYLGHFCTTFTNSQETKPKHGQKSKTECQKIAKKVWKIYPNLLIVNMKRHREIQCLRKANGDKYSDKTIHGWLSEIAPQEVRKPKSPSKEIQKRQAEICKKLGIPIQK